MAEIYKTKRLKVASAIFIALIVIGFITFRSPVHQYSLSVEQTIAKLSVQETTISPIEVFELISSGKKNYALIDVRSVHEYLMEYLPDAINVPLPELMNDENLANFKNLDSENVPLIIYGKDIQQANGAFMLLRQLGIKNIKLLTAGFNSVQRIKIENLADFPQIESKNFDEGSVNQISAAASKNEPAQNESGKLIVPVKKAKKAVTAGGC